MPALDTNVLVRYIVQDDPSQFAAAKRLISRVGARLQGTAAVAVAGFFAVPYTIVVYPIVFFVLARMWSVSHVNGFVTPADFVRGRYGSRGLSLAVSVAPAGAAPRPPLPAGAGLRNPCACCPGG